MDGAWIQVYAGTDETTSPLRGELRLFSMPIDPNDGPDVFNAVGTFTPPVPESSLSIVSVSGVVLRLEAPSGDKYTFNVATLGWAAA